MIEIKTVFPRTILKRTVYLDRIRPFIGQGMIKVLTGQRRVGKSYLLFQIIQELLETNKKARILYINKEDLSFSFMKTAEHLHEYVLHNKAKTGKTYVFIDEIQEIENFGNALRSLILQSDLDVYCTGSNANLLSSDIAGHLSGRYMAFEIYSLSYEEFMEFHGLNDNDETLEKFMKYGGLPYLMHLELKDEIVFEYLKNIYQSIVYRDIINRFAIRNVHFLEQLILFLASNTGSIFSAKKISDFLKSQHIKMAPNQVQNYIQHLVNAFLLHEVGRYDIIGKRMFEIGEKYYFENLGIRHGLWGYRVEDKGKIMENIVYNHLVFNGFKVSVGVIGKNEVDFIGEKNGEKIYIQVALSIHETQTIEREFGNLMMLKNNYPKMLITLEGFSGNTYEGIENLSLREFLLRQL